MARKAFAACFISSAVAGSVTTTRSSTPRGVPDVSASRCSSGR